MRLDFIPGTMCDQRVWSRLLPHIALDFIANHVSLSGRNDRDSIRRTLLNDTAEKANLVAFSMGGYLALEHVLAHPDRVNSLTVIAASAKGLREQEATRRQLVLDHLRERSYTGMPMAQILSLLGEAGKQDAEAIQIIREMDRDLGKETLLSQLSATMDRPDRMNDLKVIQCPVLIIGASHDPLVCVADLEQMRDAIVGSRLAMLDCGHMVPLEAAEMLGREMTAFLRMLR